MAPEQVLALDAYGVPRLRVYPIQALSGMGE